MRRFICLSLALFLLLGQTRELAAVEGPLGVSGCVRKVLAGNPNLKRLEARARQAEAHVSEVLSGNDFKLGLTGNYLQTSPEIAINLPLPIPIPQDNKVVIPASAYALNLTLSKLLTSFGQTQNSGMLAAAQADGERLNFLMARRDMVHTTFLGYLQILRTRSLERLARETIRAWEEHLRQSEALLNNGVVARYDVLRAEVEVSKSRDGLTAAAKAAALALAYMKNLIGMKYEDSLEIPGDDAETMLDLEALKKVPLDEARRTALAGRSEMDLAECLLRQGEAALRIARGVTNPSLNFATTYTSRTETFMSRTWQWQTGLFLNIPIFTGRDRPSRIGQAEELIRQASWAKEETALRIGLEVETAWLSFAEAVQRHRTAVIQLAQAKEGLRLAELRYRESLSSSVEMVDAQTACTSAGVNLENCRYNEMEAALNLEKSMGYFENGEVPEKK
jgi:outer membrane protein TolC